MCVFCVCVSAYVGEGCASMCVNGLSPLVLARVHTLTPSHLMLYMCPPQGTPYPLSLRASTEQTLNTLSDPPTLYVYAEGNPVSVEHHGDQACPHSFFISSKPAQSCLFAGRVRDTAASEQVSGPLDKRVVQHPFHLNSLSGVDAPENITMKKKQLVLAAVKGCMLLAFIHDIFNVCFMEDRRKKNTHTTRYFKREVHFFHLLRINLDFVLCDFYTF